MKLIELSSSPRSFIGVLLLIVVSYTSVATAQSLSTLHSFAGSPDGAEPLSTVIADSAGNLYGTSQTGGNACGASGCGTVFRLSPAGAGTYNETILHNFAAGTDGSGPYTQALFADSSGNLYGTTAEGGSGGCAWHSTCGTVFRLSPSKATGTYAETVLWRFGTGTDGAIPLAGVIGDNNGNLYGTTVQGGSSTQCGIGGCGTVYKLTPTGTGSYSETVLWSFSGGADGAGPRAGLVIDKSGNLYGTTVAGGGNGCTAFGVGCGVVYKLMPTATGAYSETVIYSFAGGADGARPNAGLIIDSAGGLYGTTSDGGANYVGAVYKLTPNGTSNYSETVLYSFGGSPADGGHPYAGVVADAAGVLYGTTQYGGGGCVGGCGTVYKLSPTTTGTFDETVLYRFTNSNDGATPFGGLFIDSLGSLYGTTYDGGSSGHGTVFTFSSRPDIKIIREAAGYYKVLFGVTQDGGGAVITAGGKIIVVPPRPGDRVAELLQEHLNTLVQAIQLHEEAQAKAAGTTAKSKNLQSAKALQSSINTLQKAQTALTQDAAR
jgi:uncharacterized repeat protein (TIGR03803 family)